jgi:hypothetical protein
MKLNNKILSEMIEQMFYSNETVITEAAEVADTKEKRIVLPKFSLSETWGQKKTTDGEVIKNLVNDLMSKIQGKSIVEKINSINNFVVDCDESCVDGKKVPEILANLVFLDTLTALMNDYNPQTAGTLFEPFLAALIGGTQIRIGRGEETKIEDIETSQGSGLSVKFISPATPTNGSRNLLRQYIDVKGSLDYLVAVKYPNEIVFHQFTVGEGADFTPEEFPISPKNLRPFQVVTLKYGTKSQLRGIANKYVGRLGERLTSIYSELDQLSKNINDYFVNDNTDSAKAANRNATAIKQKTSENL